MENICCHPDNVFFYLFQQRNAKTHSACITTAWLHSKRVQALDGPACSPDLFPIEHMWCIMKHKIQQWTVEHFKSYIKERISELKQLASSVPKHLLSVVKRKGDYSGKCTTSQLFECIFTKNNVTTKL